MVKYSSTLGLSAFGGQSDILLLRLLLITALSDGGTQVKFNRRDENVLASSHMNEVHIWDRRASANFPFQRSYAYTIVERILAGITD